MTKNTKLEDLKNWITRPYADDAIAPQKIGSLMCNQSINVLNFLAFNKKDAKDLPAIINCTIYPGAAIGASTGVYSGVLTSSQFVSHPHIGLALKIGIGIFSYGSLPVIMGGLCSLFGAVGGGLTGLAVSVVIGTYTSAYGAIGLAVRSAGDAMAAHKESKRPAAPKSESSPKTPHP